MTLSVTDIRQKIDTLDNQIHDLLMERAALVTDIAAAKKKAGVQIIQPDREAIMMRRLMERHHGPLPGEAIIRIWRELVGAVCLLQTGLNLAFYVPEGEDIAPYWDMMRNYFGSLLPVRQVSSVQAGLSALRDGHIDFLMMPAPDYVQTDMPWWIQVGEDADLNVLIKLPFGGMPHIEHHKRKEAFIVSRFLPSDSGDDLSYLYCKTDQDVSRSRLADGFVRVGLDARSIWTHRQNAMTYVLIELAGFINQGDPKLDDLKHEFKPLSMHMMLTGSAPLPPKELQA